MKVRPTYMNRFVDGEYSRADYLAVKSLFADIYKRGDLEKYLGDHWNEVINQSLPEGNMEHILDSVYHQIQHEARPDPRQRFIRIFQRIAAILIVPLLLGSLALFLFQSRYGFSEPDMAEIQCPLGVRTKFVLPDGTTGFLNNGSTLEYPVSFKKERKVTLSGEAYFDVSYDEDRAFVVNTPHLSTLVLGTQFNVIAYKGESSEEIILREGTVEVLSSGGRKLETLAPDQKMEFNILTGQSRKSQVEASNFISWTEGKLVFRNESIEQVAKRMGRWYNVDIVIQDSELLDMSLRATFTDEPLEEVLKLLALIAPMDFQVLDRETTFGDVYKKKKVILSLDRDRLDAF